MPEIYSNSRLKTFEQCPLKFKFRYKDKIIPEIEKSIEAHLGGVVHLTLEWLYLNVKNKKIPSIEELIKYYSRKWEEDFSPDFINANKNLTPRDYFNKGVQFLLIYYMENKPFDDNTIDVEKKVVLELDENRVYKVQGFIDRLSYNLKTEEYEIHDYKTSGNPPRHGEMENDRQLALYSMAIKERYGKDVSMIWHYLAYNKKVKIKKTEQELEKLKLETLELIKKIEATVSFPPIKSPLCNWCEYKSICPAWGNKPPKVEKQKTLNEKEELLDIY